MTRNHNLPPRSTLYKGSSSGTKNATEMRSGKEDEPCKEKIPAPLDFIGDVKELHVLSYLDLSKLIRNAENGNIKLTKSNGSSFEINVEILAKNLAKHLISYRLSFERDEQQLRYLVGGFRLLHTLCKLASSHLILNQVLRNDNNVAEEMFDLIFFMISSLNNSAKTIHDSSQMVLLHSALLASSLYLLTAFISSQWGELTPVLLSHPRVDEFTSSVFTGVGEVINFVQVKLSLSTDTRMKSTVDEVNRLFQICEASLQFLQSLCQQKLFLEYLLNNKELCENGVVLQLVHDIMKLPQCEDPHLMAVVYRLKSKVLSIMLHICAVKNSSFLDMISSTTPSLDLANSIAYEVLEVQKMMFCGDLEGHPRGILQLNAMRLTEIFADDSNFRSYIVLNLTEALTEVFTLPQVEFLWSWCSSDLGPTEEDVIMDYDSLVVSGQVLGVISTPQISKSTLSTFWAPQTSYAKQRSALLVKIVANLTCFVQDVCKEENGLFVNMFLKYLQKEIPNLPDGVAHVGGGDGSERVVAATRNLRSFVAHAQSLVTQYLHQNDVDLLWLFYSQLEQLITQESNIHQYEEVHNKGQCSSPTPQRSSPDERDRNVNEIEGLSLSLAVAQLGQLNFKENDENQSNVGQSSGRGANKNTETKRSAMRVKSSADSIKNVKAVNEEEMVTSVQSEENLHKKRKRNIMNDIQIGIIESTLLDEPDMQRKAASLQLWADQLSLYGSGVTSSQLKNWLNNRKAKLARAAAKDARLPSGGDSVLTDPVSNSPESHADVFFDSSPYAPQGTHQKDVRGTVLRIYDRQSSETVAIAVPTNSSKRAHGQYVMLTDGKGNEIGKGCIHLANGIWFGQNLEQLGLCVVDVNDLRVDICSDLPHPCDATGTTFGHAEMILGRKRVLWESSKLLFIQQ